jgi:hypothetical protein
MALVIITVIPVSIQSIYAATIHGLPIIKKEHGVPIVKLHIQSNQCGHGSAFSMRLLKCMTIQKCNSGEFWNFDLAKCQAMNAAVRSAQH